MTQKPCLSCDSCKANQAQCASPGRIVAQV